MKPACPYEQCPVTNRTPTRPRSRAAFTQADLLALVAGILVLTALVQGPLARSRRAAHQARCEANLKEINRAVNSFAEENGKALPGPVPEQTGELQWWYKEQVKHFLGLTGASSTNDLVFACPDDRGYSDPRPFHLSDRFDYGSYVYNGVLLPGLPGIAGLPTSAIKQPARTLLVMEWTAHAPLSWHRSRTGQRNAPFYRDAESVTGFVDGHVTLTKIYYDGYNAAYTQDPIAGYDYQYSPN